MSAIRLELSEHSEFGVAGLVQAVQTGNVAIANTLGSGLVESPVFMAYLPQFCQALLDEPLAMPGVATWWCGDDESREFVLERIDELDIQPAFRRRGLEQAAAKQLADLIAGGTRRANPRAAEELCRAGTGRSLDCPDLGGRTHQACVCRAAQRLPWPAIKDSR